MPATRRYRSSKDEPKQVRATMPAKIVLTPEQKRQREIAHRAAIHETVLHECEDILLGIELAGERLKLLGFRNEEAFAKAAHKLIDAITDGLRK